jgi:uncharacterized protein (AIM24 family)
LYKIYLMRKTHEIDYKIYGEEPQFVEVELDPGETVIGEPSGFMMMGDGIEMQTLLCAAKGVSIGIAFQRRLASRIIQYSPQFGSRREEGNILGNFLDGDGF